MAGSKRTPIVTREQIRAALDADGKYGPIVSPEQAAAMLGLSRKTIDDWTAKGRLKGTFRKRGKHNLFWRDKVIELLLNGPEWPSETGSEDVQVDGNDAD